MLSLNAPCEAFELFVKLAVADTWCGSGSGSVGRLKHSVILFFNQILKQLLGLSLFLNMLPCVFTLFNGKEKETLFWRVPCKHKWPNSQSEPIGHSSPTYQWNATSHLFSSLFLFLCLCFDFWEQVKRNVLSCVWCLVKRTKRKCMVSHSTVFLPLELQQQQHHFQFDTLYLWCKYDLWSLIRRKDHNNILVTLSH